MGTFTLSILEQGMEKDMDKEADMDREWEIIY